MQTLTPTTSTKNTAIILGATGNLAFALGVVLKGLQKYNQTLLAESDIIIYYQNMDEQARNALGKILPCRFIAYTFPHMENMRPHVLRDYGEMTFVRYECFRYLKDYQYVLWLDADILIQGDISGMRRQIPHGIGFRREYYDERVRVNFTQDIEGFDMQAPHFNAGIMAASQALTQDKDTLSDWCYNKTAQISEHLYYPDQGILLLMCQHFGLTIDPLDEKYNCEARRNHFALKKATLVHAVGHRKFWKYYYFDQWFRFYKQWVCETGLTCNNRFPLFEKWGLLKYPLFQAAPNPSKYPFKFITYLLRYLLHCNA
jgi:lipopolysaccharide biosynthesis glycosyltransferase